MDYSKYTEDILSPVLIITGKKDFAVGADTCKTRHFKNSRIIFYQFAYASFQEEPEWFAIHILWYFQETGANSSDTHGYRGF